MPRSRCRRAFAGGHAGARPADHLGGRLQCDRHHLSRGLPLEDDRREHQGILEDVADNLFNPDPYYQQGGDMVRVGGMGYTINVDAPIGSRIGNMSCWGRRTDRAARRSTWWRVGARSTKTCKARRSGTWSAEHLKSQRDLAAAAPCRQNRARGWLSRACRTLASTPHSSYLSGTPGHRRHADTALHPHGRGAGRLGELPVAVRAAAGAALPGLSRRHHHRADDASGASSAICAGGWCWPPYFSCWASPRCSSPSEPAPRCWGNGCRPQGPSCRSSPG